MIKAVIFDCFGVLYVDSSRYFYQQNLQNFEELEAKLLDLNKIYDRGLATFDEHVSSIAELTGLRREHVRQGIHAEIQLNQDLLDYSQSLRSQYKLGMLSNIGLGGMDAFFDAKSRQELFDEVVLSSETGMIKPDPEIFKLTAAKLGVEPWECIMIDDNQANCAGAVEAGMYAVLYSSNEQAMRDTQLIADSRV